MRITRACCVSRHSISDDRPRLIQCVAVVTPVAAPVPSAGLCCEVALCAVVRVLTLHLQQHLTKTTKPLSQAV